jgi:antirestriction protein
MNEQEQRIQQEPQIPEHERPQASCPQIWVGSLADYNAGRLHGAWIDAAQEAEDLQAAIQTMLETAPTPGAEEWSIFDSDGFGCLRISEMPNLWVISEIARGIVEHGYAFAGWAAVAGTEPEQLAKFEAAYLGIWNSVEDYTENLLDDLGYTELLDTALPEPIRSYVRLDVARFARDLELGGQVVTYPTSESDRVYVYDGMMV